MCDNCKAKSALWSIFDTTVTLTLDILTSKCEKFIRAPKTVSDESLVKFRQQIPKISCWQHLFGTHARTDARTRWKHNASGHYVGEGIKNYSVGDYWSSDIRIYEYQLGSRIETRFNLRSLHPFESPVKSTWNPNYKCQKRHIADLHTLSYTTTPCLKKHSWHFSP